jgi:hypothetical protein
MTDEDCPGEKGHKEKIELAAKEIVRRLGGNVQAALVAVAAVAAMSASREWRSKGGKKRAKDLHRATWDRYRRKDVLKELKAVFRGNRSIKKAAAVRHLRQELNPDCADKTLENLFDKWKATEKRIFSKNETS